MKEETKIVLIVILCISIMLITFIAMPMPNTLEEKNEYEFVKFCDSKLREDLNDSDFVKEQCENKLYLELVK